MEERAKELYNTILTTAGVFLHQSKTFSVDILNEASDPSFPMIAKLASQLVPIIETLAVDFDPMMHQKALDYTNIMSKMALAIESKQQDELDSLVELLNKKPFV